MTLNERLETIVFGKNIKDKMCSFDGLDSIEIVSLAQNENITISTPGRNNTIKFSNAKNKFPKNFEAKENKARALHFFANHELLAIEIMAKVLLTTPLPDENGERNKIIKSMISTIEDEQKHLKLYIDKINTWGYQFGDFPVNDFFWKHFTDCPSLSTFFATMSLTFEAANLDFAALYATKFEEVEDYDCVNIMNIVLEDEIKHVSIGAYWLKKWKKNISLKDYYLNSLPCLITPARSKGIHFRKDLRLKANLDEALVEYIDDFDDGYSITTRKKWKK